MFKFHEGETCEGIIRYLEAREHTTRRDVRVRDKGNHTLPDARVEMTFRLGDQLYAIEHTGIEGDFPRAHGFIVSSHAGNVPLKTDDPFGLHRPGWRIPSGGSERDARLRDSQRKAIEEAQAEYLDRLTNAWKDDV